MNKASWIHRGLLLPCGERGVAICGKDIDSSQTDLKFNLTADWHTLGLAIRVENSDIDIGRQVPPVKMRDKVGVPEGDGPFHKYR
jgi:hypothetical protein